MSPSPRSLAFALPLLVAGACMPPQRFYPTRIVPTATPGVAYVIVDPFYGGTAAKTSFTQGDGLVVRASDGQYILLCDARPADGMHCLLVSEVSKSRYSFTKTAPSAAASVYEGIAVLHDEVVTVQGQPSSSTSPSTSPSSSASIGGAP